MRPNEATVPNSSQSVMATWSGRVLVRLQPVRSTIGTIEEIACEACERARSSRCDQAEKVGEDLADGMRPVVHGGSGHVLLARRPRGVRWMAQVLQRQGLPSDALRGGDWGPRLRSGSAVLSQALRTDDDRCAAQVVAGELLATVDVAALGRLDQGVLGGCRRIRAGRWSPCPGRYRADVQ